MTNINLSVRDEEKYSYIEDTSRPKVLFVYIFGILSWSLVLWGFSGAVIYNEIYRYLVGPLLLLMTIYHFVSFGINLFFKQFDLNLHHQLVKSIKSKWNKNNAPCVDIFLPICGEKIEVLQNTWHHVSKLDYPNFKAYVLDDSKINTAEHKALAESYNFTYVERPNKGEMKKAGNLKYSYERTSGEYIVIFDADFAPHTDFINETIPYLISDKKIGILQTPQFFDTTTEMHNRSMVEYGASYVQEDFYRVIQVSRDRLGGTLCCGSNAVYRREALDMIGGTVQIEHSEDAHTGFSLASLGWKIKYIPVVLAKGLCPDDLHNYFHQQHRWCSGSMSLMLTKKFWQSKLSFKQKLCYISGFMYYLHHPIGLLLSFQLFISIYLFNDSISILNAYPFYPFLIFSFIILPWFRLPKFRIGSLFSSFTQLYAYSHAVFTGLVGKNVGWIPTNARTKSVSSAFNQTTVFIGIYIFFYILCVAVAVKLDGLHLFDYNYYSLQFWIFWNLFFSSLLLHKMLEVIYLAETKNVTITGVGRLFVGLRLYVPYIIVYMLTLYVVSL